MHRNLRALLRDIRIASNNTMGKIVLNKTYFSDSTGEVCVKYDPLYARELTAAVDYLIEIGYLTETGKYSIALTYKGLHPYYVRWIAVRDFIFRSILIPIAVSAATALLTLWLKGLLWPM